MTKEQMDKGARSCILMYYELKRVRKTIDLIDGNLAIL